MDLNKSSVPQYCILFRLILQVARFSIAFYFVNISLVPVHSPLSILPGLAQCGLWFQFGDSNSALRTEGSNPDPSQWNEGRRQTLSNLSEYHGTLVARPVPVCQSQKPRHSLICPVSRAHQSVSTLPFVFYPNPILPQLFRLPSERGCVPTKHPPSSLFVPSEPYSRSAESN